jgi:hypothetical protein
MYRFVTRTLFKCYRFVVYSYVAHGKTYTLILTNERIYHCIRDNWQQNQINLLQTSGDCADYRITPKGIVLRDEAWEKMIILDKS